MQNKNIKFFALYISFLVAMYFVHAYARTDSYLHILGCLWVAFTWGAGWGHYLRK